MKKSSDNYHIIETIDGCYDMINYLSITKSVTFKTDVGTVTSKDKQLVQYLLKYFKSIRNKYESKL